MDLIPFYKGDFYYASGSLLDFRYEPDGLWGKIKVKLTDEWVDTFFAPDSYWIIWESLDDFRDKAKSKRKHDKEETS